MKTRMRTCGDAADAAGTVAPASLRRVPVRDPAGEPVARAAAPWTTPMIDAEAWSKSPIVGASNLSRSEFEDEQAAAANEGEHPL